MLESSPAHAEVKMVKERDRMICPIMSAIVGLTFNKVSEPDTDFTPCRGIDCAWWNKHFGQCSIAVEAYLKGLADHRLEVKQASEDRYG